MFTVTKNAQTQIADYFRDNEKKPIRIFLSRSCSGMQLSMALDERKDTDMLYKIDDVEYLVDEEFLKQAQPIEVDFKETGFRIQSSMELGGSCSNCGTTGSCCS